MTLEFKDDFIERIKEEGRAEGRAEARAQGPAAMFLRILTVRGLEVPNHIRERVLACTDLKQLEAWADKAVTATSVQDVFSD